MPKIDLDEIPQTNRTGYPDAYAKPVERRVYRRLGPAAGLTDFGVSHVTLLPGAWSGQRHWHEGEDEFLVMVTGTAVLVDDAGRTPLVPGDCVAYPKGEENGHHLVNEGVDPCMFVVVGGISATDCHYPDIDLHLDTASSRFTRKDGTPY